eukprot:m.95138 g.95138  ORF g.95138 m.95138 type:complete len:397 (-) comp15439_c1_seq5:49-1239(-)
MSARTPDGTYEHSNRFVGSLMSNGSSSSSGRPTLQSASSTSSLDAAMATSVPAPKSSLVRSTKTAKSSSNSSSSHNIADGMAYTSGSSNSFYAGLSPKTYKNKGRPAAGTGTGGGAESVLMHNSKTAAHYVFGREAAGSSVVDGSGAKEIPMRRIRKTSESDDDEDGGGSSSNREEDSYVEHIIESHHTLRGIALQYRLTVDQLKRFNNMWTDDELHSRKTLRIPAHKDSYLYNAVLGNEPDDGLAAESDTTTHTTRKARAPVKSGSSTTLVLGPDTETADSKATAVSKTNIPVSSFLEHIDKDLEIARSRPNSCEVIVSESQALLPAATTTSRSSTALLDFQLDWRYVTAALVCLAIIAPIIVFFIAPNLVPPPPTTHHDADHGHTHDHPGTQHE